MEEESQACTRQLSWYSRFNLNKEFSALTAENIKAEIIIDQIEQLKAQKSSEEALEICLSDKARIGLDPRRWFSAERVQYVKKRDESRAHLKRLKKAITDQTTDLKSIQQACEQQQKVLNKYRAFNPLEVKAKLNAVDLELEQQRPEFDKLFTEKKSIDDQLKAPLSEHRRITEILACLESDLKLIESFDKRLKHARNSYEKAMIHEECSKKFAGQSRPNLIKQNVQREIHAVRRQLNKIEERLSRISRNASRQISTLVIDGNNLCYQGHKFIGLSPLHALTHALSNKYHVIVVFDASIRQILRMNDRQVTYGFPDHIMVHVVATKQAADQTVLELASESKWFFVISCGT